MAFLHDSGSYTFSFTKRYEEITRCCAEIEEITISSLEYLNSLIPIYNVFCPIAISIYRTYVLTLQITFLRNSMAVRKIYLNTHQCLWLDFLYSIKCQVLSWIVSKGPRLASTCTWYLPLKSSGTRHEYRQPLQPYSNLPESSMFPASSTIFNSGLAVLIIDGL